MKTLHLERVAGWLKVNDLSASSFPSPVSHWLKLAPLHFLVLSPSGQQWESRRESRGAGGLHLGSGATEHPDTAAVVEILMKPDP